MNPKRIIILSIFIMLFMLGLWLPAGAAPNAQQYATPTPGTDGRILYVVQPGDNCFRVAALHNMTVDQLRQLNSNLDENCTLVEGTELLIAVVAAATPTVQVEQSLVTPTITPTPLSGLTQICVLLFNDVNGNAAREETEAVITGGAISVTEINGKYSASQDTALPDGECFDDVPEGTYNITVGIPDNFNPTMSLNYSLEVKAGDRAFVDFGAQSKDVVVDPGAESGNEDNSSTGLIVFGVILLLGGAGLGYYAWRSSRPESKLAGGGMLKK